MGLFPMIMDKDREMAGFFLERAQEEKVPKLAPPALVLVPCQQGHQNPPVPQNKHDQLPCQRTATHGGTRTGSSFHPFVLPGFAVGLSVMGSHLAAAGSGFQLWTQWGCFPCSPEVRKLGEFRLNTSLQT